MLRTGEKPEQIYKNIASYCRIEWLLVEDLIVEVDAVIDAIKFWQKRDSMLEGESPTPEEILAGINEVTEQVGHTAVVMRLGKDYGLDPDVVYDWTYKKVWNILRVEHILNMYQERLMKVHEKKAEKKKDPIFQENKPVRDSAF